MKSKYNNKKIFDENGRKFDSLKEYNRFKELKNNPQVKNLQTQVTFILIPSIPHIQRSITYKADFVYTIDNEEVVEDVKSPATLKDKVFQLKKKLFRWKYGKDIKIFI